MADFLPIRKRGNFFKDDFFRDYQSDFDSAISKVVDRFSGRSMLADQFSNYRKMKKESGDTETAASISDTKDSYVIVLDMSDYVKGSISVSASGRNAIVEANMDDKKFYKRYPLPQIANTDVIKCAMSDEGILTITAAKHIPKTVPLQMDDSSTRKLTDNIPLKVEIDDSSAHNLHSRRESTEFLKQESVTNPTETRRLSIDRRGNFFQDPKFEGVWSDFEVAMDQMLEKSRRKREQSRSERRAERDALFQNFNKRFFSDERKSSFDDDFFDTRKSGRFHTYRNLRKWDPEDATQAMKVNSSDKGYKIVMDVKDVDASTLSVKTADEGLIVSGGHGETSFKRRFSLPGLIEADLVNATISEDGILTVSAPFK